jgi:hypothetical protein
MTYWRNRAVKTMSRLDAPAEVRLRSGTVRRRAWYATVDGKMQMIRRYAMRERTAGPAFASRARLGRKLLLLND